MLDKKYDADKKIEISPTVLRLLITLLVNFNPEKKNYKIAFRLGDWLKKIGLPSSKDGNSGKYKEIDINKHFNDALKKIFSIVSMEEVYYPGAFGGTNYISGTSYYKDDENGEDIIQISLNENIHDFILDMQKYKEFDWSLIFDEMEGNVIDDKQK